MKSIPIQRQKAVLLAGLYSSQGLGMAFVMTAVPTILRQSGAGLDTIGLIFVLGFLWSVKFLWAPLIDRYGSSKHGHYRGWIIVSQILLIIITIGTSFFFITNHFALLSVLFVLLTLFASVQDVATDGLAVSILKPGERAVGNSIQSGGNMVSFMLGGGVILIAYPWFGWQGSLLVLAGCVAIPLIVVLKYRELPRPSHESGSKTSYKALVRFFRRPRIWHWVAILLVYRISGQTSYWFLNPFLVDLGWSIDRIGTAINIVGILFGVIGAALAGFVVNLWGRKTSMLANLVLGILGIVCFNILVRGFDLPVSTSLLVYLTLGLIMISFGFTSTVMYTVIMDKCDPASAATDFTLQWSLTGISSMVAGGLAMALAEHIGYAGVLNISIGVAVLTVLLVWFYDDFELKSILHGETKETLNRST